MLVKICGIKTAGAAKAAMKYGADFLGFNFVPSSKRLVRASEVKKIISALPKNNRRVCVGVFMNQTSKDIKTVLAEVRLNMLQFHGKENAKFCSQFGLPYIKAFGVGKKDTVASLSKKMAKYKAKYFLLDRKNRGRGEIVDLNKVRQLAKKFPVMLSGGLTPENVKSVISRSGHIVAVDVAGGVEKNGKKSSLMIKGFISKAKSI